MSGIKSRIKRFITPTSVAAFVVIVVWALMPDSAMAVAGSGLSGSQIASEGAAVASSAANGVALLLANILLWAANIVSSFALYLMEILLVPVVSYSNFINHPVVTRGWALTRDVVNIGFIAVLLMIAFGTMFGISRINWRQQIPLLLIGAIAVNFSRLIVGLLIDIGQVIMIAFVNAIQHVGAGNFIKLMSFDKIQSLSADSGAITGLSLLGAAALALIMSVIVFIIILILVAILTYRIVILWVLIITAPIAFLIGSSSGVFKSVGGEYGEWWNKLVAAITVGPVLLFFLWLALASVSGGAGIGDDFFDGDSTAPPGDSAISASGMDVKSITSFIIAIALLMAGIEAASRSANQLGGLASKAIGVGQKYANAAISSPVKVGGWAGRKATAKAKSSVKSVGGDFRNWNLDRTSPKRQRKLKDKRARLEQTAATGSRGDRMRARAKIDKIDAKLDAEKERMAEAVKGQKGKYDNLSFAQKKEAREQLKGSKDINDKAALSEMENSTVMDSKSFEKALAEDPDAARAMYKSVRKRAEDNDDEATVKRLDSMAESRPSLAGNDRSKLSVAFSKMDKNAIKKINVDEFNNPEALAAAIDSGIFDDINTDGKGHSKSMKDMAARFGGAPGSAGAAGRARVLSEQSRFETEKERIATDAALSGDDRKVANRRNSSTRKVISASLAGDIASAMKNVNLADVDVSQLDPADIRKMLGSSNAGQMGNLQNQIRENRTSGTPDANLTAWDTRMRMVRTGYVPSNAKEEAAYSANSAAMDQSASGAYGYSAGAPAAAGGSSTGAFGTADGRRQLKQGVTSQPEMILNLSAEMDMNGGDNDLSKAIAETVSEDSLKAMLEGLDASRGSDSEIQQQEVLRELGDIVEQWEGKLSGDLKEQVDKAAKFYRKRVHGQISGR